MLLALGGTLLTALIVLLYKHYGIDSWSDLIREIKILKFKYDFALSQILIKKKKTNYLGMWKSSVTRFGNDIFLEIDKNRVYTYKQIDELSNSLAKFLHEKNVRDEDTVGVMMTNSVEFVVTWLALIKLGARPALLSTGLKGSSLVHCLRVLQDCNLVLINESFDGEVPLNIKVTYYTVNFSSKATGTHLIGEKALELTKLIPENPAKFAGNKKAYDGVVGYLFTSGTTGNPKAVPFAFNRLWSILKICFIKRYSITRKDSIFSTLPLYHSTGLCIGLHITMLTGGRFILRDKLSVNTFWSDMLYHEATVFMYVGEMCRFLLNRKINFHPHAGYKTRLCIGNGLGADIYKEFKETFRIPEIAEFYGQTECFAFFGSVLQKPGSLGYVPKLRTGPNPYRVVKCVPETMQPVREHRTGLCELCNSNEKGLLIVRTSRADKDRIYHNNNEDVSMVKNVEKTGDMFISTGDMVMIGSDRSYYFVDRLGDTYRWKGENVSTTEVATCIHKAKGVNEVCVYGVTVPGHNGKCGMAALILKSESDFSMSNLYEVITKNLPQYAIPGFIRIVQSFVTTSTHKYKTSQLQSDGYNPSVSPNMYAIDKKGRSYQVITENLFRQINSGEIAL